MSDFNTKLKDILSRSAKFIGQTANTAAKTTKYKVNEISVLNKRRELVGELGKKVLELCSNGLVLPEEGNAIVDQIKQLDAELSVLRADHAAEKAAAAEQHAMEKAARAAEKAAVKTAEAIEKNTAAIELDTIVAEPICEVPMEENAAPTLEMDVAPAVDNDIPTLNV